jgi:flagellar basal-body rod protein FlgB
MFNETHYMKTQDLLERGLNNAMFRRKVISDNIANADVPNFKRSDVSFEANLKRAIESEKTEAEKSVPTRVTNEKHFEFFQPLNYKDVKPKANLDYLTRMRADGNNVDIEKEVVTASQNQMAYTLMVERFNQNSRMLNIVMRLA